MKNLVPLSFLIPLAALAQQPLQGPNWRRGETLSFTGSVLAIGAPLHSTPCVQVRVESSERFSGGRAWVCDQAVTGLQVSQRVAVGGVATDTRLAKMGGGRRVVPVLTDATVRPLQ